MAERGASWVIPREFQVRNPASPNEKGPSLGVAVGIATSSAGGGTIVSAPGWLPDRAQGRKKIFCHFWLLFIYLLMFKLMRKV